VFHHVARPVDGTREPPSGSSAVARAWGRTHARAGGGDGVARCMPGPVLVFCCAPPRGRVTGNGDSIQAGLDEADGQRWLMRRPTAVMWIVIPAFQRERDGPGPGPGWEQPVDRGVCFDWLPSGGLAAGSGSGHACAPPSAFTPHLDGKKSLRLVRFYG
jgi:hypothetical protein